ncbi:TRAP transporter large permease [Paraburkholderia phenoliruptrix]|uniref:TRAP transporter large permease n=1 Tax=Paraburkholderia phenoliruptrix TaxID=252970 RepID=UPI002869A227|nr:TRAP transporter large permease subunit [Paraburkholderia phenoliruptrix]WMY11773.1 TRAP transporter large permease subunit [Paraburkholderia phenoliruptrix]
MKLTMTRPAEPAAREAEASYGVTRALYLWVSRMVEIPAAILVVAEIIVLLAGVTGRYVFQHPLVWTDELASILFLWLAMLGSAVALRRGEHMRMTALVARFSPAGRAFLDVLAVVASMTLLVLLLKPSFNFASDQTFVTTPALGINDAWRASAMPVGFAIMTLLSLLRLATFRLWRLTFFAVVLVAAAAGILIAMQPVLFDLGNANLIIFFVVLVGILVFSGVPIAFSFGLATFGYLALTTTNPLEVVVGRMDEGMSHLILLAVPLFVFLGQLIEMTGMAKVMVDFLASLLGHVRGGLSYVLVGAMYLVSGISGSKAADMAAIAPVLLPEMKSRGVKQGELVALLAATGAQTETVPPSLVLITIGSVTGVSISALFTGGLLPGVVLAIALCLLIGWRSRKQDLVVHERQSLKRVATSFIIALPALALPFIIRSAVIEGVATATEVSTVGILYSFIVGIIIYRRCSWRRLIPMLVETAALSGAILLIIGAATGMAWSLTQSGFSHSLAKAMSGLPGGAVSFIAVSIVCFVILGSVLEGIPAIVLFGPLLFPVARQLGVHEVHYAMIVVLAMGLGLFAPPFGVGYYSACAISKIDPREGMKPILMYMAALMVGLIVVACVPWISIGFLE